MKNISVDIGYKLGGVLALSTILAYAIDFKLFLNPMFGVGFFYNYRCCRDLLYNSI